MASRINDQQRNSNNYKREVKTDYLCDKPIQLQDFLLENGFIADKSCIPQLIKSGDLFVVDCEGNKIKKVDKYKGEFWIRNSCIVKFCKYPEIMIKFSMAKKEKSDEKF